MYCLMEQHTNATNALTATKGVQRWQHLRNMYWDTERAPLEETLGNNKLYYKQTALKR